MIALTKKVGGGRLALGQILKRNLERAKVKILRREIIKSRSKKLKIIFYKE